MRSLLDVALRMHELNGARGVTLATSGLAEPVAARRMSVEHADAAHIGSVRVCGLHAFILFEPTTHYRQ